MRQQYSISKTIVTLFIMSAAFLDIAAHEKSDGGPAERSLGSLSFIENKGQWTSEVVYKAEVPNGALFLTHNGFVYNFVSATDWDNGHAISHNGNVADPDVVKVHHHAFKVRFSGANAISHFRSESKRQEYHNYFINNDPSKWKGGVGLYGKIVQEQLYRNIDLAVYSQGTALKYDFVVAAGGNPHDIRMVFEGVMPVITSDGNLHIKTSVNEVVEQAPYAYQVIDGQKVSVKCNFSLQERQLSFALPDGYDSSVPLIIDPVVVFASYSGSTGSSKNCFATTYDKDGALYTGAQSQGPGWPVTIGAFQTTYANGFDVAISKFNATGSALVYATYYGGAGEEHAYSMIVNDRNELVISGVTRSANLPVSAGCYDATLGGTQDLFVARFSNNGASLLGATYLGGSGVDGVLVRQYVTEGDVALSATGDIWVAANTASSNFPVTLNALQLAFGGRVDGVLCRLREDCTQLLYSTYVGGSDTDACYSVIVNPAGNIVICGETKSANFPVSLGALNTSPLGACDGFVSIVNPVSGGLLRSSFLGTAANDRALQVRSGVDNSLYVQGQTIGNYPVSAGVYSLANADVFITKLNPALSTEILTTRMGNPFTINDRFMPTAFMVDTCGNIYTAGINTNANLPVTANAFTSAHRRFWIGVLKNDFTSLLYGSFFGSVPSGLFPPYGEHVHQGVYRSDPQGIFYHSICTDASTYPATGGSFAPAKLQMGQEVVSFKFDLRDLIRIDTVGVNQNIIVCFADSVLLNAASQGFDFRWSTGGDNASQLIRASGTYTVMYRQEGELCKQYTDTFVVDIYPYPVLTIHDESCPGMHEGSATILTPGNPNVYNYVWYDADNNPLQTTQSAQGDSLIRLNPGVYSVNITAAGCNTEFEFSINALPEAVATFTVDTKVCVHDTLAVENASADSLLYIWDFGDGSSFVSEYSPKHSYKEKGTYVISLLTQNKFGCTDTTTHIVSVNDFDLYLLANKDRVNFNDEILLQSNGSDSYTITSWEPAWKFSDPQLYEQRILADSSRNYFITALSDHGCADTATAYVSIEPFIWNPTAFTPNGDGLNDLFNIIVLGEPVNIIYFRVFDRWGKKVFDMSGTNALRGWDGTFKGAPVELGTYFYVIGIETSTGDSVIKQGDVTLIR